MKTIKQLFIVLAFLISGFNLFLLSGAHGQTTISGTIRYLNSSLTPMDGIRVNLTDLSGLVLDTIQTNEDGFFIFHNIPDGNYFIEPQCVKPWGGGASNDALLIMKHFVGMTLLSGLPLKAADVDASSFVNAIDALTVMKRFVGMISFFSSGDWAFEKDLLIVSGNTPIILNISALCFGDVNGSYSPPACIPHPTPSVSGPDQLEIQGTTTNLDANTPSSGTGEWKVLSGSGGSFADPSVPTSGFTGLPGTTYTLVWTITTTCFSSCDTVVIGFASAMGQPCPGLPGFVYGGQTYNTVQIGNQCWMKENLNAGTMIPGNQNASDNAVIEKYCMNNNAGNCAVYGALYQWDEVMQYTTVPGSRGICSNGWHVPTDQEWCTLTTFLDASVNCNANAWSGINAGGKMKETGTDHWSQPNAGATNESGFTALGAGSRILAGQYFGVLHQGAYFWTSSEFSLTSAIIRNVYYTDSHVYRNANQKLIGFSVRCIKDTCVSSTSSDAGPGQINVTGNSATLAANEPGQGETGTWDIISGTGGSLANTNDPGTAFSGTSGETYQLTWTITNSCHTSIDSVVISFASAMGQPCPGIPGFVYGGQTYNTVQIGNQCWMKENLNIGTMVMSVNTGWGHSDCFDNGIIEKYCNNNDPANCAVYGGLYDWNEMMQYTATPGTQGICPVGWHIPTDLEWTTLANYLGGNSIAGGKMKETGFMHWNSPNTGATNESGFTALGAGYRFSDGFLFGLKSGTFFWSSSVYDADFAWDRSLWDYSGSIDPNYDTKTSGYSVRCLQDSL